MIARAYRLRPFEEAVGTLSELMDDEGVLVARIGKISIHLPEEMERVLRPLLCQRIGILRTDAGYRSRVINSPRHDEQINVVPSQGQGSKGVVG